MQRRPENLAAAVNGLIVFLAPVTFLLVLAALRGEGVSNTSTHVTADIPGPAPDVIRMFGPFVLLLVPFALIAAWRTRVHAIRRLATGSSGWAGVVEAGVLGFAVAILVLGRGILTRPMEAPPYVIFYGGAAFVLGLIVGVVLRLTALVALKWQGATAVVALLIAFASASPIWAEQRSQSPVAPEFLLQSGRAGEIEAGQPVDDIYRMFGRERVRLVATFNEGQFGPELEVRLAENDPAPALVIPVREWPCPGFSAWAIHVLDRRYRTVDGLGVGSTLGELRKRYPRVSVGWGEGNRVAVVGEAKMTFMLDPEMPSTDSTPVISVLVLGDIASIREKYCPARRRRGAPQYH